MSSASMIITFGRSLSFCCENAEEELSIKHDMINSKTTALYEATRLKIFNARRILKPHKSFFALIILSNA
jgi:hypothetical protein